MGNTDRLRRARYVATCYLEHHPGIYEDVFDHLRGLNGPGMDDNIRAAAALYTPVVNMRPEEWRIRRGFGDDVCDLLLETTYDPMLSPESRMRAIQKRLSGMERRGRTLQLAVLKAFFRQDLENWKRSGGADATAGEYCRWLEKTALEAGRHCPELTARLVRVCRYHCAGAGHPGTEEHLRLAGAFLKGIVRGVFLPRDR